MPLYALDDAVPEVHPTAWIAPTAVLIGRVKVEAHATIWFGAVLRGDNETITIGRGTSIQENCVLHTDPGYDLTIGADVTVGHLAMLHGCIVGDGSLIGMQASLLNGCKVGARCLVAAHALILENREIPDDSLVTGSPGKVVKPVTPELADRMVKGAGVYVARGERYRRGLRQVG
jgi:carbonic anhydrase/acetyltransferase-like protein (isoleucine patch superfamily)